MSAGHGRRARATNPIWIKAVSRGAYLFLAALSFFKATFLFAVLRLAISRRRFDFVFRFWRRTRTRFSSRSDNSVMTSPFGWPGLVALALLAIET
jgi:hypothetical protein